MKAGAAEHDDGVLKPWQTDYQELIDFPGLFDEYLEMGMSCSY